MTHKMTKMIALASFLLAGTTTVSFANTLHDNKVLRNSNGVPVVTENANNCVRTNWETENNINPCKVDPVTTHSDARLLKSEDKTVTFDFDSAQLDNTAKAQLDKLAQSLHNSSDIQEVTIMGYTDRLGNDQYNKSLSVERAKAVQSYLAEQGYISTKVAEMRGYGELNPVKNCSDAATGSSLISCLEPNRRVEVEITFTEPMQQTSAYTPADQLK